MRSEEKFNNSSCYVKVPEGEMFGGKQMLLGNILVNGEPLRFGGQIADAITVGLYAIVIAGGPSTTALPCSWKCCLDAIPQ